MSERPHQPDPRDIAAEAYRSYTEDLGFSDEDLVDLAPDVLDPQAGIGASVDVKRALGGDGEAGDDDDHDPQHAHALSLVRTDPPPSHKIGEPYIDTAAPHIKAIKQTRKPYVPPEEVARQRRDQQLTDIVARRAREVSEGLIDSPDQHDRPA